MKRQPGIAALGFDLLPKYRIHLLALQLFAEYGEGLP
jgi:hypothetical protein